MTGSPSRWLWLMPWRRPWSLAVKVGLLNIGLCAALAVALTWLGTYRAIAGLQEQAEAALAADARVVADGVDGWHAQRMAQLKSLANMRVLRGYLEHPTTMRAATPRTRPRRPDQPQQRRQRCRLHRARGPDAGRSSPAAIPATSARTSPSATTSRRRCKGRPFISGVSISTITNAPSIFHSVPVRSEQGVVLGVLRSRSRLDWVQQIVQSAHGRVGAGATGVLLDESGLVISSSVHPDWQLRPVVPLSPELPALRSRATSAGATTRPRPLDQQDLSRPSASRSGRS